MHLKCAIETAGTQTAGVRSPFLHPFVPTSLLTLIKPQLPSTPTTIFLPEPHFYWDNSSKCWMKHIPNVMCLCYWLVKHAICLLTPLEPQYCLFFWIPWVTNIFFFKLRATSYHSNENYNFGRKSHVCMLYNISARKSTYINNSDFVITFFLCKWQNFGKPGQAIQNQPTVRVRVRPTDHKSTALAYHYHLRLPNT